jgi:hypothetical protein
MIQDDEGYVLEEEGGVVCNKVFCYVSWNTRYREVPKYDTANVFPNTVGCEKAQRFFGTTEPKIAWCLQMARGRTKKEEKIEKSKVKREEKKKKKKNET